MFVAPKNLVVELTARKASPVLYVKGVPLYAYIIREDRIENTVDPAIPEAIVYTIKLSEKHGTRGKCRAIVSVYEYRVHASWEYGVNPAMPWRVRVVVDNPNAWQGMQSCRVGEELPITYFDAAQAPRWNMWRWMRRVIGEFVE